MDLSRLLGLTLCFTLLGAGVHGAEVEQGYESEGRLIRVCADDNDWFPYTYLDRTSLEPTGVHLDLFKRAALSLGYRVEVVSLPWKRCLEKAAAGDFDAVASAAYTEDRAKVFAYPPGAEEAAPSPWRLTQVNYVLVCHVDDAFEFSGDWSSIPTPARVPRGYSLAAELASAGVVVDEAPKDRNNFLKLLRDRTGVVVATLQSAVAYNTNGPTRGKLRIHSDPPLRSKSYFVVFSRAGRLAEEEYQGIWDRIAEVRGDGDYLARLLDAHASANIVDD